MEKMFYNTVMETTTHTQRKPLLTREGILHFLKNKKEQFKRMYHIKEIGLFGSYSRGDHNEGSDIDIVYVLKDGQKFGYFEYLELSEMFSRQFNKHIELVNYKYMNPIIKQKAEREIIYV